MIDLKRADQITEQFLAKANRQNEPLQYYMSTKGAKKITGEFESALKAQAKWVGDWLKNDATEKHITDDFEPLTSDQAAHINSQLFRDMPKLSQLVSNASLFLYLKDAFEYGIVAQYLRWGLKAKKTIMPTLLKVDEPKLSEIQNADPTRANHQKELEDAHNAGDVKRVKEIIDSIDVNDPYKSTMESVFADDIKAANAAIAQTGAAVADELPDSYFVTLTNQNYIASLKDYSSYLLQKSSIDDTTRNQLMKLISEGKQEGLTIDEIADYISDRFDDISYGRAFVISNTETNRAMSQGQAASMKENGVQTNRWVPAGEHTCPICDDNAADDLIPIGQAFNSGDTEPPAHPSCECYLEAGEIDLESIDIWSGE